VGELEMPVLSLPLHELYEILATRLLLHGTEKPFSTAESGLMWLLREYGERYQIRELFRVIT
jgi:hypothetical protein